MAFWNSLNYTTFLCEGDNFPLVGEIPGTWQVWCWVFKSALKINLQRTCSQTAPHFQVLCLANKQLRTLLLFKQDSFISNACTTPIEVKESRSCLKTWFILLLSFGLLIKTPGEGTASCLGNSGFQSTSKGIVNNEQRDGIESRRYERKKKKITEKRPCYRVIEGWRRKVAANIFPWGTLFSVTLSREEFCSVLSCLGARELLK